MQFRKTFFKYYFLILLDYLLKLYLQPDKAKPQKKERKKKEKYEKRKKKEEEG